MSTQPETTLTWEQEVTKSMRKGRKMTRQQICDVIADRNNTTREAVYGPAAWAFGSLLKAGTITRPTRGVYVRN